MTALSLQKPVAEMAVVSRRSVMRTHTETLLLPKLTEGIQKVGKHLANGLQTLVKEKNGLAQLIGDYKGYTMIRSVYPLESVLIDTLGALIGGQAETESRQGLRNALRFCANEPQYQDMILGNYLQDRGLTKGEIETARTVIVPQRDLIAGGVNLHSIGQTPRLVPTPQ